MIRLTNAKNRRKFGATESIIRNAFDAVASIIRRAIDAFEATRDKQTLTDPSSTILAQPAAKGASHP